MSDYKEKVRKEKEALEQAGVHPGVPQMTRDQALARLVVQVGDIHRAIAWMVDSQRNVLAMLSKLTTLDEPVDETDQDG